MQNKITYFRGDDYYIVIPAFHTFDSLKIEINATKLADGRMHEAQWVNPSTYGELEHIFNEAFKELKRNITNVGYLIASTENELAKIKSALLIDKYPDFIKERGSKFDNADMREAFLLKDKDYASLKENIVLLNSVKTFLESRIKIVENVMQYMRNCLKTYIKPYNSNIYYNKE